jgi:hypothetical protein
MQYVRLDMQNNIIKVAGIEYTIEEHAPDVMGGRLGLADFNAQHISINQSATPQTKKIAIYHEIMHIISDAWGLGLTESQVKIGTHALIAFLAENPEFQKME